MIYTANALEANNVDELGATPVSQITTADPQADNNARASFAAHALHAYSQVCIGSGEFEEALTDLLGDLRHLADALGLDYGDADYRAHAHYVAEIHGQG
jgi:hypothetical protein